MSTEILLKEVFFHPPMKIFDLNLFSDTNFGGLV